MTNNQNEVTPQDARQALRDINTLELAAWRRSVPPRWVCTGYAFFSGGTISMFAIEPLKVVYFSQWLIAYIIFMSFAMKSISANEREYHPPKDRRLSYWSCWFGLLVVGFGGIYLRYDYDAPWLALAAGLITAIWTFVYYEVERRGSLKPEGQDPSR